MKIILLGMPGAGKGTQAELIKVNYNIPSISTGAILRDISNTNSDLGAKVQDYLGFDKRNALIFTYFTILNLGVMKKKTINNNLLT